MSNSKKSVRKAEKKLTGSYGKHKVSKEHKNRDKGIRKRIEEDIKQGAKNTRGRPKHTVSQTPLGRTIVVGGPRGHPPGTMGGASVHKDPHPKKKPPGKPNRKGVKGPKPLPKFTREKGVLVGRNPAAMKEHLANKKRKAPSASKSKK